MASNGKYCNYCSKYNLVNLKKKMQVTGLKNLIFIAKHSAGKHGSKIISFPCFLKEFSKGKREETENYSGELLCSTELLLCVLF